MTTYAPEVHVHHRHVNWWLVAVVGLAAALVALGAWVLVDRYTGSTAAQDTTTLIDDANAAFTNGDAAAIPTYYASTAVIRSFGTNETYVGVKQISALADGSFSANRISPVTVDGEYASTFVELTDTSGQTATTLSVYQIKDGLIERQWNFLPGFTPPLDNAA